MKKFIAILCLLILLTACTAKDEKALNNKNDSIVKKELNAGVGLLREDSDVVYFRDSEPYEFEMDGLHFELSNVSLVPGMKLSSPAVGVILKIENNSNDQLEFNPYEIKLNSDISEELLEPTEEGMRDLESEDNISISGSIKLDPKESKELSVVWLTNSRVTDFKTINFYFYNKKKDLKVIAKYNFTEDIDGLEDYISSSNPELKDDKTSSNFKNPIKDLDEQTVLKNIRQKAKENWPGDKEMEDHQYNEEKEAYHALLYLNIDSADHERILKNAHKNWENEYGMIKDEYDNQAKSLSSVDSIKTDPIIESMLLEEAKDEWGDDHSMVANQYHEQLAAYKWVLRLEESSNIDKPVLSEAKSKWDLDYIRIKYHYEQYAD